jgi:hypothetical protein
MRKEPRCSQSAVPASVRVKANFRSHDCPSAWAPSGELGILGWRQKIRTASLLGSNPTSPVCHKAASSSLLQIRKVDTTIIGGIQYHVVSLIPEGSGLSETCRAFCLASRRHGACAYLLTNRDKSTDETSAVIGAVLRYYCNVLSLSINVVVFGKTADSRPLGSSLQLSLPRCFWFRDRRWFGCRCGLVARSDLWATEAA